MKFAMEQQTLVTLGRRSETESDDLGMLVKQLMEAAQPMYGQFNGPARAAFDGFKNRTDEIAKALNGALAALVTSIAAQNLAFTTGAEEGAATQEAGQNKMDWSSESTLQRIQPRSA